ncbi:SpoIID/LytB domain-containing protein [[Clostridium] fimetarium]|uniref:Stage II sporulation protein D n=1 Tax=[Clostridium] fimetarium TaxID=99656 RepID=A0A1I0N7G0_9FIRM|nr:SpoIID/LytB domain-containing protein [[Clostridium] fimetarium]SEV96599.1 stage II sporulation protein D [[Clostridium] fimetarium]
MNRKRKKLTLKTVIIVIGAVIMSVILLLVTRNINNNSNTITRAEAAKMIAGACVSDEKTLTEGTNWYDKYVTYVNEVGYMHINEPKNNVTYGDIKIFLDALGKSFEDVGLEEKKDSFQIKKNDFVNLYIDVIGLLDKEGTVKTIDAGIIGTPSNISEASEWQAYTTEGIYNFEGLVLDNAIDKTATLIVKGNSILCVQKVSEDDVTYKNVWVESGSKSTLKVYAYGAYREFKVSELSEDIQGVLADINISNKKVTGVDIKTDTIKGKVLSVTNDFVEIDGYGKVPLEKDYKIYNTYNGFAIKTYTDIVVGYSLQDFIVADGEICGAIISKPLNADNIRVLIKTNGSSSLFHNNVQISSDNNFTLYFATSEEKHNAGEVITIDKNSPYLVEGRVKAIADTEGLIKINSINRSQGTPSYEGSIEIALNDEGLTITNEVLIEKYLKRVVPSEMPVNYGVEALKVQAICARSYAYKQLTNSNYSRYGAHVDDSTQYQVYNNVNESAGSNEAIASTDGEVITYNNEVVQAYYYSTSCGYTTDVSLWGSNPADYPYFTAHSVNQDNNVLDLTNEDTFTAFIKNTSSKDFDKDFSLYRWKCDATINQLSDNLNSKIGERYKAYPDRIQKLNANGTYESKSISTVGKIKSITVDKRVAGGAITCLIVKGSEATVKIDGENNIRYLLGIDKQTFTTTTGGLTTMSSLPSTFCIFEPTYAGNELTGFTIAGGGYGHGIGMSQNAVYAMTNRSWTYNDIIQYFYNGTTISKVY